MTEPGDHGWTAPPGAPPYGGPPPPPQYGYGPPPQPPQGISDDDTTWAIAGYLGQFVIGFVAPLVVYFARKDQSPFVRFHGAQALNACLTHLIIFVGVLAAGIAVAVASAPVALVFAILVIFAYGITNAVYLIVAAVKAGRRETYRLPAWISWNMIK
ncbi:DUF4870 domain-containing protein [Actinomadura sp. DC4]|uniref:DUF4870 domain-containing protein n=1 Tax=Actinomadura sp. DC4 TaxID=3055069 RepID=UPI0025AF08E3|nr:DUF4870 domain-containing protein [Actinomadura sp. DC4]MDN3353475.1 DUF4870 domain-containing protein [Actinomadura sp. DC4]